MNRQRTKTLRMTGLRIITLLFFVSLYLCGKPLYAQESITIAVASSFYQQALSISKHFEAQHHIQVRVVSGSTGRLYNQIKQGAPFDVFIAAGTQYIDLHKPHKAMGDGYLAVQLGNRFTTDLSQLMQDNISKIAIANPQTAPFGAAAKQVLEKQGVWQTLKPKLVYAQNAMQASMMVNQGLVDAAFVPVQSAQSDRGYIASIPYSAFLLTNKKNAQLLYQGIEASDGSK